MLAAIVAGALLVGSCTDRLLGPAGGVPMEVGLAVAPAAAVMGGDANACAHANQAHVRLAQSSALLLDSTLAVSGACDQPITLKVHLNGQTGALQLSLALLANGQTLFQGATTIQLHPGMRADVQLPVVAVPAGLVVPDSLRTFTTLGDSVKLGGAVVFATGDTVQGLQPSWTDDGKGLVSVVNGFARARGEGSAVLTASYNGFTRSTRVGVKAVVAAVAVNGVLDTARMYVRATRTFTAVARDSNRWVLQRPITWTSGNPRVATIDTGGVAMGVDTGHTLIIAAAEGCADSFALAVTRVPVARVEVMPGAITLETGDVIQLSATTYDAAGVVLADRAVTWTSGNSGVATVSSAGLVSAVGSGSAVISATSEGVSGSAQIRVLDPPVLRVIPGVVNDTVLMFRGDTTGPALQVTNAGEGTLGGLSVTVSYPGVEYPDFIRHATLDRTVAPATLRIVYRDSLWYDATTILNATVTVSSTATGTSPVSVPVTLTVLGPVLRVSPAAVDDTIYPQVGGPLNTATLQVTNAGGGTLSGLSVAVSYPGGEGTQTCMDSTLLSSTVAPATLTLFYADSLRNETTCTGTIVVSSTAQGTTPVSVPLALAIIGPVLHLDSDFVNHTVVAGTPDTVRAQVTNTGVGTLDGLSVTVDYAGGPAWLAGYSLDSTTAPATLTLTAAGSLTVGSYYAIVLVRSAAPGTVPWAVSYWLTVQ
jgi:hypothetical protein